MDTHKYDDIINLEHHVSKTHKPMSREARAAQFAPFAALTGHEEAIEETTRLTENKKIIDENFKSILDDKITTIINCISEHPEISITYFIPDTKKSGGSYSVKRGHIKKIDDIKKSIIFCDGTKISLNDVIDIETKILDL